ncbi:MAG: CocE/NonD family hydrolase [Robiginitalea sp.]|uniref:CocE/NonD family hydrolase n=2 Tax=Robiginitalea sp. TaxID=1902411 RepID=UPI003C72157D
MKTYLKILVVLALAAEVLSVNAQQVLNIERTEIQIPLSDGVHLGAIVYAPAVPGKYPAIVYRTPYGIDSYDSYAEFPRKAAHRGYLVFLVDVRGRYRSEGDFEAYKNEKQDGYDLIEWVANHPLCNGKVGTYGGSYPGIVQWQAMSKKPPHLTAAAPEMTPIGSHHFFYNGGAFSMTWLDWFVPYIFPDKRKRAGDTSDTWDDDLGAEQWAASDRQSWYEHRPLNSIPILKPYAPEFFEWLAHPDLSEWWDFANMEKGFSDFVVPVFLLSGWYDASYGVDGASRAFKKIHKEDASARVKEHSVLVLGPWNHTSITTRKTHFGEVEFGPAAGMDYDALLLDWFDRTMSGKDTGWAVKPVNVYVMGSNRWRSMDAWPPEKAAEDIWYLRGDNALGTSPGPEAAKADFTFDPKNPFWDKSYEKSYPYDQRENEARADVLTFTSAPMQEDMEILGEIKARLFVSSTAEDTDFSFTITDVYPDGRSINLTGLDAGYLRMRYRDGFASQKLMKPGEVYEIVLDNVYTGNVFKKGHSIRISITSSKAPHYDPNPNTGREIASESELKTCVNTIYFGGSTPSSVILPLFTSD